MPSSSSLVDTVRVPLAPSAGFCIKSVTTDAGYYTYVESDSSSTSKAKSNPNLLEPKSRKTIQIPKGVKVFLNIAWDRRVPAPPEASEEVVRRAMAGADLDEEGLGAYYVPVVVSEPREDADKSGKPSVVFDCVFSASLKARCMKDKEFKMYLIELALEHVEEKAHITLSRQVGTPNIASKGKLEPRTVLMPRALVDPNVDFAEKTKMLPLGTRASPLVQELPDPRNKENESGALAGPANDITEQTNASAKTKKSILKPTLAAPASGASISVASAVAGGQRPLIQEIVNGVVRSSEEISGPGKVHVGAEDWPLDVDALSVLPPLRWKWGKEEERVKIEIDVPDLTRDLHARSTLDIEPRRILLHIPQKHFLDINLDLSDAQIGKVGEVPAMDLEDGAKEASIAEAIQVDALRVRGHNAGEALRLKRQRDFDVEKARAEWRVGEKKLVITV